MDLSSDDAIRTIEKNILDDFKRITNLHRVFPEYYRDTFGTAKTVYFSGLQEHAHLYPVLDDNRWRAMANLDSVDRMFDFHDVMVDEELLSPHAITFDDLVLLDERIDDVDKMIKEKKVPLAEFGITENDPKKVPVKIKMIIARQYFSEYNPNLIYKAEDYRNDPRFLSLSSYAQQFLIELYKKFIKRVGEDTSIAFILKDELDEWAKNDKERLKVLENSRTLHKLLFGDIDTLAMIDTMDAIYDIYDWLKDKSVRIKSTQAIAVVDKAYEKLLEYFGNVSAFVSLGGSIRDIFKNIAMYKVSVLPVAERDVTLRNLVSLATQDANNVSLMTSIRILTNVSKGKNPYDNIAENDDNYINIIDLIVTLKEIAELMRSGIPKEKDSRYDTLLNKAIDAIKLFENRFTGENKMKDDSRWYFHNIENTWGSFNIDLREQFVRLLNYASIGASDELMQKIREANRVIGAKQTNPVFNPTGKGTNSYMGQYACYFRTLEFIAEEHTGKTLTEREIITAREELTKDKYLNVYTKVLDSPKVIEDAFRRLGFNVKAIVETSKTAPASYEYLIKRYERWDATGSGNEIRKVGVEPKYTHFVLVDKNSKQILFDPDPRFATPFFTIAGDPYTLQNNKASSTKTSTDGRIYDISFRYVIIKEIK